MSASIHERLNSHQDVKCGVCGECFRQGEGGSVMKVDQQLGSARRVVGLGRWFILPRECLQVSGFATSEPKPACALAQLRLELYPYITRQTPPTETLPPPKSG